MSSDVILKSKTRPVLFSLLTLLSGIIIGAGVTLICVGPLKKDVTPLGPEFFSRRMVERMTQELSLTPQQQEAIRAVIETHMKVIDQIREEVRPQIRQELDTMNAETLALLDDNQKQLWKESIERMQRRFREARERRGPRDGDQRRDREGEDRDRFRRGDGPGPDPNSRPMRRWRSPDNMPPDMMPPRRPPEPRDPNQPPIEDAI